MVCDDGKRVGKMEGGRKSFWRKLGEWGGCGGHDMGAVVAG